MVAVKIDGSAITGDFEFGIPGVRIAKIIRHLEALAGVPAISASTPLLSFLAFGTTVMASGFHVSTNRFPFNYSNFFSLHT